ncbi:thiamine kinase [Erwinia sp. E602]|uniref:thiamine kinase n=1 Tax=Erwinia sp. E602 TaxID=2675378 RepID=UPI002013BBDE|nr:thiamine kinase [Erwinia sp. E602]
MKLSGQAAVPFSTDPALGRLIRQHFPAADIAAGCFTAQSGLSGGSVRIALPDVTLLARRADVTPLMPGVCRRREYRILRKLAASGVAPQAIGRNPHWLLLGWQAGQVLHPDALNDWLEPLAATVARLHQQPPCGYRLTLLPLLQCYWQRSQPARRTLTWLRALRRLARQGEPRPLRLAPLHMDIHSGNLINAGGRLRLIDWEYASDGDVALELAAIISGNGLDIGQQQRLITAYAGQQQLLPDALSQQIHRWLPWLTLLASCWYELRWQQSGETNFLALAEQGWRQVKHNVA